MREARTIIRERSPDLAVEGEMRGDAALSQSVLDHEFPESGFVGPANVLVILTPSSTVRRIVNMAAVAAADAVSERA